MKAASEMTDAELLAACGLPEDCPKTILFAVLDAMVERWTREGLAKVEIAAREQAKWTPDRKEAERLRSLRDQRAG